MRYGEKFDNPSRSSPKSSSRGCLCKDKLIYSRKCCDGTLWAQGIGNITRSPEVPNQLITQNGFSIITQDNKNIVTN